MSGECAMYSEWISMWRVKDIGELMCGDPTGK